MKRRVQLMIDEKLYPKIKSYAGAADVSISSYVENILREYIGNEAKKNKEKK